MSTDRKDSKNNIKTASVPAIEVLPKLKKTEPKKLKKSKKHNTISRLSDGPDSKKSINPSDEFEDERRGENEEDIEEREDGVSHEALELGAIELYSPEKQLDEKEGQFEDEKLEDRLPIALRGEDRDLLKRYISDVSRYPLLTPDEEFSLAVRLRDQGDLDAAKRLVSANLRLVVKIAMEYRSAYQNVLDLIQEGNVGLMKAVSKYDPSKGAKLSYYAAWWIRSYILKYILDNFRLVRLGTTQAQKKLFFHLMREKERLEAQGLDAGPKLLADRLNVREQDVIEMEQRLGGRGAELSLNAPIGGAEDESKSAYMDLLEDNQELADEELSAEQLKKILNEHIREFEGTLGERELAVFKERMSAENPKTLQEVADLFGLTRERVRQLEVKVIEKLRDFYQQYLLR